MITLPSETPLAHTVPEATQPEGVTSELFGINVDALLRFGRIAVDSTLMPSGVERGLRLLPQAVKFAPLIESIQTGSSPSPEELQPYRQVVRETFVPVALAEKVAAILGERVSGALNNKLDAKIVAETEEATRRTSETIKEHLEDVQHVASFENPREQFTSEIRLLSRTVSAAIRQERNARISGAVSKQEAIPGFKGVALKVIQKVKGFFKRLFGKKTPQTEITAYDAGLGIHRVVQQFKEFPDAMGSENRFPLLNRFIQKAIPKTRTAYPDYYAVAAPEILSFLYSGACPEDYDPELIASITRNPHDVRFITRYGRLADRLAKVQSASRTLIPAFKELLPESNAQILEALHKARVFFHPKPYCIPDAAKEENNTAPQSKTARAKSFFGSIGKKFRQKK